MKLNEKTIGARLKEISERIVQFDGHPALSQIDINFPPTESELATLKDLYDGLVEDWEALRQFSKKHSSDGIKAILSEIDKRIVQFEKLPSQTNR